VFLAAVGAERKPDTIALLEGLMAEDEKTPGVVSVLPSGRE
jgi:hypothetical protein